MLTSLQALLRLPSLRWLGVFLCALAVLLTAANTASALKPAQTGLTPRSITPSRYFELQAAESTREIALRERKSCRGNSLPQRKHSSLALFTPAEVFFERRRRGACGGPEAVDAADARHPARFPHGPPKAALPPEQVHINPLEALTVSVENTLTIATASHTVPSNIASTTSLTN